MQNDCYGATNQNQNNSYGSTDQTNMFVMVTVQPMK